jgi:hypothetical protein
VDFGAIPGEGVVAFLVDREVSTEIDDPFTLDQVAGPYPDYFDELRAPLGATA